MMMQYIDPLAPEPAFENLLEFILVLFLVFSFWRRVIAWKPK